MSEFEEIEENEMNTMPTYEDILAAQEITFQDVMDHMTGPVVSVVFHIIVAALAGSIVVFESGGERHDIEVEMKEVDIKEIEKPPEPPEPVETMEEVEVEIEAPDVEAPEVEAVDDVAVEDVEFDANLPDLNMTMTNSALKLPGVYALRSGSGRKSAVKKYAPKRGRGASARQIEASTGKALGWFADNQNEDGSWGKNFKPAMTSLALLALFAHGETPTSENYGEITLKGIKFLCANTGKSSIRGDFGEAEYTNAMVAYALSEGYALTKIPMMKTAMDKQVEILVRNMAECGGYARKYDNMKREVITRTDADMEAARAKSAAKKAARAKNPPKKTTSRKAGMRMVTTHQSGGPARVYHKDNPNGPNIPSMEYGISVWHYQALKAAYIADCQVEGLNQAIERAVYFTKNHALNKETGAWGYQNNYAPRSPDTLHNKPYPMTTAGVFALQFFGEGKSVEAKKGLKFLEEYEKGAYLIADWQKVGAVIDEAEERSEKYSLAVQAAKAAGKKISSKNKEMGRKQKGGLSFDNCIWSLYTWYYQTQVYFQAYKGKGKIWNTWNQNFTKSLVKEQERDGSWTSPAFKYSRTAVGETSKVYNKPGVDGILNSMFRDEHDVLSQEASQDLKVYSTAMCTLMMTVYYR